jgi:purine-nucleoside phosphorylase
MSETIEAAADAIRAEAGGAPIETVIVLGTGLGAAMDNSLEDAVSLPYSALPGFPRPSTSGREGRLAVGTFEGARVACLTGRAHYYEQGDPRAMAPAFETLAVLGAHMALLTCAVGSTNADMPPGTLVLISDHINLSAVNPLVGLSSESAFVPMTDAYDSRLAKRMRRASIGGGVPMREGIYMWFPGPSFETPAEIRAARALGADIVGMSVVPETILARRLAWRVAGVGVVTNFGAGFMNGNPSHAQTREMGQQGSIALKRLIRAFFKARDEAWGVKGREHLR